MEFTASPSDVIRVVDTARKLEANPLHLAGRFLGLGQAEQRAGIPTWAWMALAFGAGAAVVYQLGKRRGSTIRAVR